MHQGCLQVIRCCERTHSCGSLVLACRLKCGAYAGVLALPGWPAADFAANGGKGAEAKLNAVLLRAEAIGTGAQLKKSQGRSHALPDFEWASC